MTDSRFYEVVSREPDRFIVREWAAPEQGGKTDTYASIPQSKLSDASVGDAIKVHKTEDGTVAGAWVDDYLTDQLVALRQQKRRRLSDRYNRYEMDPERDVSPPFEEEDVLIVPSEAKLSPEAKYPFTAQVTGVTENTATLRVVDATGEYDTEIVLSKHDSEGNYGGGISEHMRFTVITESHARIVGLRYDRRRTREERFETNNRKATE